MAKNKIIYILISLAVSAALIGFLLSQIKAEDLLQTLKSIYLPGVFLFMAVALLGAGLRSWRYKMLLRPRPITWGNILLVTFIRNSLIDLLPARIGSLSFIYVLNKRLGFPFEKATSVFVMAFILDFMTLSPFLVFAILAAGVGSSVSTGTLLAASSIFFLFFAAILRQIIPLARWGLKRLEALFKTLAWDKRKAAAVTVDKFRATIESLSEIRARRIFFPVFCLSLLIRLAKYVSIYVLFFSLLRSHGFALSELSIWKLILGISGAELTSVLPIKGLAGFGTWESAWALSFRLMNFDPDLAIISGIGVHLLTNIFEYSLGLAAILILALPYLKKTRTTP